MASQIIISRFGLYPNDLPEGYCVGFSVTCNGYSMYTDTIVPLNEAQNKTNEQIVDIAYNIVKNNINGFLTTSENKQTLVGQTFSPIN